MFSFLPVRSFARPSPHITICMSEFNLRRCHFASATALRYGDMFTFRAAIRLDHRNKSIFIIIVEPAIQHGVNTGRTHSKNPHKIVNQFEITTFDQVVIKLANQREKMKGGPADCEQCDNRYQHLCSFISSVRAALDSLLQTTEDHDIQNGDHNEWEYVLEQQQHDGVQTTVELLRPVLGTKSDVDSYKWKGQQINVISLHKMSVFHKTKRSWPYIKGVHSLVYIWTLRKICADERNMLLDSYGNVPISYSGYTLSVVILFFLL